jgi:DNA-binding transcriptional ArsR family regulator
MKRIAGVLTFASAGKSHVDDAARACILSSPNSDIPAVFTFMPHLPRPALETIAASFRALSEPTRLGILQELKDGPKSVNTLVEALELSQPNISKQLRILFDAGFLTRTQQGTQVLYSIKDKTVLKICELVCDRLNQQARASLVTYSI